MKLLLFYLTDNTRHYTFPHFIEMLNKSNKKDLWKLLIITHNNDNDFYSNLINNTYNDIQFDTFNVEANNNYLRKVHYASHYADINNFPYVMKCDNDLFIKANTLDFMIDNLKLLENSDNLTIGPVLTSGIPGVEYFKEQFLDLEAQEEIENLFLKTQFKDNFCGANYGFLNKNTLDSLKWDKEAFFKNVKSMSHHYKGIHPIRVNEESLQYLNEYIIKNKERFLEENSELEIIYDDKSPYLCNSIFCIKNEIYKKIIFDQSLYVDAFEEVPLNKYCWNNNMKHLFIKNGFAIHMYYNWKANHLEDEKKFIQRFFNYTERKEN